MDNTATELLSTVNYFITNHSSQINWAHKSSPNKWSAIEILGHLTDSALVNLQRFVRCTYQNDFTLTYAQNEWVAAQNYKDAELADLLKLWQLLNQQIATVLNNYPAHRRYAKCNDQTVTFLSADYIDHMRHHLNQIIALLNNTK